MVVLNGGKGSFKKEVIVSVAVGDGVGLKKTIPCVAIAFFPCTREKRTKAFREKKTKTLELFSPFCAWCLHEPPALPERMNSALQYLRLGCQKNSKNTTNIQSKWFIPSSSYRLNVFNISPFSNFRSP